MKQINTFFFILLSFYSFSQTYTTGTVTLCGNPGLPMTAQLDISTNVTLTFTGPSTRWFALGFNTTGMAIGTDVVSVLNAGTLYSFDQYFAVPGNAPYTDAQQDWTITSDQVTGSVRTVIATRALSTGDPNDYTFTAAEGTLPLIWAMANQNIFWYAYHGSELRGITTATLTLAPVTESLEEVETPLLIPTVVQQGFELVLPEGKWNLLDYNGLSILKVNPSTNSLRMDVAPGFYLLQSSRKAIKIIVID